jgi:hypothetical protein
MYIYEHNLRIFADAATCLGCREPKYGKYLLEYKTVITYGADSF